MRNLYLSVESCYCADCDSSSPERTVPAVLLKLELAFVDGQLEALDGGRHDIRITETELQLFLAQTGEILADGAGWTRFAPFSFHHRVVEIFVLLLPSLLVRFLSNIHQGVAADPISASLTSYPSVYWHCSRHGWCSISFTYRGRGEIEINNT